MQRSVVRSDNEHNVKISEEKSNDLIIRGYYNNAPYGPIRIVQGFGVHFSQNRKNISRLDILHEPLIVQ